MKQKSKIYANKIVDNEFWILGILRTCVLLRISRTPESYANNICLAKGCNNFLYCLQIDYKNTASAKCFSQVGYLILSYIKFNVFCKINNGFLMEHIFIITDRIWPHIIHFLASRNYVFIRAHERMNKDDSCTNITYAL